MRNPIRYGSVCSGIEAASVAWHCLGWQPAWFAEIEKFPSAVLAYRWPDITNLGDMTKLAPAIRAGKIEAPDVLAGGTPCQAFSVAGLRNGLADERGQLTLAFVELVNAIDEKRREQGKSPVIVVWENVPGVFSSKDNAFGCFLAGLAGESCALESPGKRWANAGYVLGPERVIAWRVLDAQFFGVAQRRRRVFVVASARTDIDPAKILFECDGLRRVNPPTRKTPVPVCLTARGAGSLDDRETYIVTPDRRIRHLMPLENERQMGFTDNYTLTQWREKKLSDCPDGPRYKAIGNSMAVPVMRWIGSRIQGALHG
ncbi:DNA cytosine methyltransferase [Enterobacter sp. RHBSTW-00901]|uniref:DNA cytosine methyltransferase n=1 Tax=Enterobacter sp. RHBSTW-00901 TaxID=2742669 RepID=UPI0015F4CAAD|nr:DNA cytosine methyltransferase [Enterobacter sp. RHBSTW-00901]MBA7853543.1 DNA cytosine methyltransferase [Enterobacter sp. RHBSTW-00901]